MKFEEVLPALRAGKRIKRRNLGYMTFDTFYRCGFTGDYLLADDWEIGPETKRVADYFKPIIDPMFPGYYEKRQYEIGKQPKGVVLVPGSEREVTE